MISTVSNLIPEWTSASNEMASASALVLLWLLQALTNAILGQKLLKLAVAAISIVALILAASNDSFDMFSWRTAGLIGAVCAMLATSSGLHYLQKKLVYTDYDHSK